MLKISVDDAYKQAMSSAVSSYDEKQNIAGINATYLDEMQNVTLNNVAKNMGYDPKAMRNNPRRAFDTESAEYKKMMLGLEKYVDAGKKNHTLSSDMTAQRALENIQLNYFKNLSTDKQYEILAHVMTNVEQGYKEHQSDRNNIKKDGVSRLRDVYADLGIDITSDETQYQNSSEPLL